MVIQVNRVVLVVYIPHICPNNETVFSPRTKRTGRNSGWCNLRVSGFVYFFTIEAFVNTYSDYGNLLIGLGISNFKVYLKKNTVNHQKVSLLKTTVKYNDIVINVFSEDQINWIDKVRATLFVFVFQVFILTHYSQLTKLFLIPQGLSSTILSNIY